MTEINPITSTEGYLNSLINKVKGFFEEKPTTVEFPRSNQSSKEPREISAYKEISDSEINRQKYITTTKNPDYKIKSGDNIAKIAQKYGVEERVLLSLNGLDKESATKLRPGQIIKIPPTRTIKNVKNLNDVANSMGVSVGFIKKLKNIEDGNLKENQFHNTPYKDKNGVLTIGVGHALKPGEKTKLTNQEVCTLLAKDLLKMEDNLCVVLGGKQNYDKLPQSMKEALLDMTFNKGTAILEETPGLLYCLKNGKYEAAINKFTHNKSFKTKQEMSGLSKRRLLDISIACQMYKGNIPKSNLDTAQQVYNRGIELLRAECRKSGANFENMLKGYNADVQKYFGNKLKLVQK